MNRVLSRQSPYTRAPRDQAEPTNQSLQKRLFADAIGQRLEITVLRNEALVDAVVVPTELAD
jgi:hypothetical protein